MANNLAAWNNERFQVSFDVSAWGAAYTLTDVEWRMQVRAEGGSTVVVLEPSASYAAGVVTFVAPLTAMSGMAGSYAWDFGFAPADGDFVRIDGGTLTINQGVTR